MSNDQPKNVCRLCLGRDIHLFSLQDPVLPRMIWECTSLEVLQNDNLPQSICKTCFASLEFSHKFRKQCLKSDEFLRNTATATNCNNFMLSSPIDDVVKDEDETKTIKLEDGFSNNENGSDFITEEEHIKPEIKENESDHSDMEDYYADVTYEPNQKEKESKKVRKSKKMSSKRKSKERSIKKTTKSKKSPTAKVPHLKKEKKVAKIKEKNPKRNVIKKPKKLKNMPLKRFQCDFCGKTFKRKEHFENHVRTHTGEKPYACDMCPKTFAQKHNLKTHTRTHTRERPYSCVYCGNRFIDHSAKYRHEKIHTNDKKYPCPHCSKRFMTKYDLNKHVMRHTGGKFHQCSVCFQSYADESSLNNHMKIHTEDMKIIPAKIAYNF